jgi:hypothetical protein
MVASSKLEHPPGDRVETDRRDAERLVRLLRISGAAGGAGAGRAEEAARELVPAREDRLSKLLLRHGLIWENCPGQGRMTRGCGRCGSTGRCDVGLRRGVRRRAERPRPP